MEYEDLRQKRLSYYNKFMIQSNLNQKNDKISNERNNFLTSNEIDLKSAEILSKIFSENLERKHLSFSSSFDESKLNQESVHSNNPKLEEFKKVVESSYTKHVLNRNEQNQIFARKLSIQSSNSNQSQEEILKNSSRNTDNLSNILIDPCLKLNNEQVLNSPLASCKIPFMSAYNIYEQSTEPNTDENLFKLKLDQIQDQAEKNSKLILQKYFDSIKLEENKPELKPNLKKLTSNGSSLNPSPTSLSSPGSVKEEYITPIPPTIEVKPPETPKPKSNLNFRKNLLRLNSNTKISLDITDTRDSIPKPSNNLLIASNTSEKLEKFFNPGNKINKNLNEKKKIKKKNKNNIFEYLNDYLDEDEDDLNDDSDNDDTFGIFSSQDSLNKPEEKRKINKIDLTIDLGQLNDSDEEYQDMKLVKNVEIEQHELDEEVHETNIFNLAKSIVQKKPENIPNLALDLIDDDKSQSVAVSLAKSMCKEIDYQKEMEMIYNQPSKPNSPTNKPPKLNLNTKTQNLVLKNQVNSKQGANSNFFMKPQTSSRQSSTRNNQPQETKFFRSKSSMDYSKTNQAHNLVADSLEDTSLHEIIEISKPDKNKNKLNIKNTTENSLINTIEAFQAKQKNASLISSQENNNLKKNTNKNSRNPIWESSLLSKNPRPNSANKNASNNNSNNNSKKKHNIPMRPKSTDPNKSMLFLNYSKLIEIETNIQKDEVEPVQSRPKTAMPKLEPIKHEPIVLKDDKEKSDELIETKNIESLNLDQNKNQTDWLKLPDEMWLKILTFLKHSDLSQFGRSCKKFNKLYSDSSLWNKIEIKYKYNMCDEWLEWIGRRRPSELSIIQCSGNLSLNAISEMFRNIGDKLTTLNLSRCSNGSLSGDNFALQASIRCPNVTNLDLSWTLLSNQTLKLIVDSFKKIETINLSGCNMIMEDGFNQLIIKHGEYLKNLEISGCIHFPTTVIFNIGAYCRAIEKLNISNCHRITNESIIEACPQWLKLKFIDLKGIKNIKNNCVSNLVRRCAHLEGLSLGDCVHIGDASVLEIATYKPNIKYLDLSGCKKISDNSLRSLSSFCSKLEILNLKGTNVSDTGLISLSNSKFISTIQDLNLSFLPISELVFTKILRNSLKLKKIHIYGCYNIKHLEEIKKSVSWNEKKNIEINI